MGFLMRGESGSQPLSGAACDESLSIQVAGVLNNFSPGVGGGLNFRNANTIEMVPTGTVTLNGLGGGLPGRNLKLVNPGPGTINIASEAGASLAANRFNFAASIAPGGVVPMVYVGSLNRWALASTMAVGAGVASIGAGNGIAVDASNPSIPIVSTLGPAYAPVLTPVQNLSAAVLIRAYFMRHGDVISVWGSANVDPVVSAAITTLGIDLPVASNLAVAGDLFGGMSMWNGTTSVNPGWAFGDAALNRATLLWFPVTTAAVDIAFWFTYPILA